MSQAPTLHRRLALFMVIFLAFEVAAAGITAAGEADRRVRNLTTVRVPA